MRRPTGRQPGVKGRAKLTPPIAGGLDLLRHKKESPCYIQGLSFLCGYMLCGNQVEVLSQFLAKLDSFGN